MTFFVFLHYYGFYFTFFQDWSKRTIDDDKGKKHIDTSQKMDMNLFRLLENIC